MKILISSLHFGPGHVAHIKAYVELAKACGYHVAACLNSEYNRFIDVDCTFLHNEKEVADFCPDVVLLYNTGFENIKLIRQCKRMNCKLLCVLHEPYMGIRELMKDKRYRLKQAVASALNTWICKKVDKVLLCSDFSAKNCMRNMSNAYQKSVRFPLIFQDNYLDNVERKYFSMIGGFSYPHGSDAFLEFVKQSHDKNDLRFQIATRRDITDCLCDPTLQKMIQLGRLVVQHGRPLTSEEIDRAYRSSICTWNGYRRSTQSGVLPNSFMQGTPVIATRIGSFGEFVIENETGEFIDNFDFSTIESAYRRIEKNSAYMEQKCRESFIRQFHYEGQKDRFMTIVEGKMNNH